MTEEVEGFRDRALVALLSISVRLGEGLGVDATIGLGSGIGRLWYALRLPRTSRVREQLAAAFPDEPDVRRRGWEREVFLHLGRGLAELLLLSGRHRPALLERLEIDGLEHLERAVAESGGQGAIVIAPHLGNWELCAAKLADLGVPVAAIYRGFKQPALERAASRVRAGRPEFLPAAHEPLEQIAMGRRAGVRFVRALGAGRSVLVLLDQRARRDEGLSVQFFGRPAHTRFGPVKLADRLGAPVLLAFTRRAPDGRRHRLTIEPPFPLEPGAAREERILQRNLQAITARFEREIRSCPGQWIWTHRRWRPPSAQRGPSGGGGSGGKTPVSAETSADSRRRPPASAPPGTHCGSVGTAATDPIALSSGLRSSGRLCDDPDSAAPQPRSRSCETP